MLIGEIKLQALQLMFALGEEDASPERLGELAGMAEYREALAGMPGAICRCLSDLEQKRVLPVKRFALSPADAVRGLCSRRFDLSALLPDFLDVSRVIRETPASYDGHCTYRMEGEVLVLLDGENGESGAWGGEVRETLLYHSRVPRPAEGEDARELAGVPEELAAVIPYFIKGDLYREEDPNEASEARNWYEAATEGLVRRRTEQLSRVQTVYGQVSL